ncbi:MULTISPECIES: hypothetical protein [Enterobacterales]|nr:hypothetical protein [Morganella morganii]AMG69501.1 hypothetical protein AL531_03625 [Morganella morganii]EKU4289396.1 hypothetical protein [Morganella morganii]EKU4304931.1 hypothetical protein [Morganella morganii]EKU5661618.1 hypothetical protein [Morganella morganii]EKU5688968.1 hypothetical protein [Morganella morganii]
MSFNKKQTSKKLASQAARILKDKTASPLIKRLAASVLSQSNTTKQTGADMETLASEVLKNEQYDSVIKSFAASALSQANKERTSKK